MLEDVTVMNRKMPAAALVCALLGAGLAVAGAQDEADRRLRERILGRLEGQVSLHPRELAVEVGQGRVRVGGTVASLEEVDTIERLVKGIVGVRHLDNRIEVRTPDRPDFAIRQDVRRRLDRFPSLRSPAVEAGVKEGRVLLTGRVPEGVDRLEAERQARSVPGVVRVDNQIHAAGVPAAIAPVTGTAGPGDGLEVRVRSLLANPLTFGRVRNLRVEGDGATIYLHGSAAREADRTEAERMARSVAGVDRVVNLIVVDPS